MNHPSLRLTENILLRAREGRVQEVPGKLEYFEGELRRVVDARQIGWRRFYRAVGHDGEMK